MAGEGNFPGLFFVLCMPSLFIEDYIYKGIDSGFE